MKTKKVKRINKALLPILGVSKIIDQFNDNNLRQIMFVTNIIMSDNWSYGWNRGKYGTITEGKTGKTYRISQNAFERMNAIANEFKNL